MPSFPRILRVIAFVNIGATIAIAQPAPQGQSAVEHYIRDSEREWVDSATSGDPSVAKRILADDFVGVDSDGQRYTKAKLLADTPKSPEEFESIHLDDVKVHFFGNVAIAEGSDSWVRRKGQAKRGRFIFMDTWLLRNGQWQIIASQDLTVAKP